MNEENFVMEDDGIIDIPDIVIGEKSDAPHYVVEPDQKKLAVKFAIVGSGQGGNRIANQFYKSGYRRVAVVNTTNQDFLGLEIPAKNQAIVGSETLGAGKDPEKGRKALHSNKEEVLNLFRHSFGEDIDRILVCACGGGGTGSGTATGLVELAKLYMRQLGKPEKVGVIVSLPKKSEGGKVQGNAYELLVSLKEASSKISPLIVVDNESINQMFPDAPAKQFWEMANQNIVGLFDIFNMLACQRSAYVTFDKADYESMLDSGILIFGANKLSSYTKDTDISDGIRNNIKRTLLSDVDLSSATHAAAILCATDKILSILPQSHIDRAFDTLGRILGGDERDLTIHQGVYETRKPGLFLYTMVGGVNIPEKRLIQMAAKAGK